MAVKLNKKAKADEARKNAEAMKAKKKSARVVKTGAAIGNAKPGSKGKSLVGQAKRKK